MERKIVFFIKIWCAIFSNMLFADVEKAETFFEAALYAEAIPYYQKALERVEPSLTAMQIRLRLGQAYFLDKQYEACCAIIKDNLYFETQPLSMEEEIQRISLYLSGVSHRCLAQYAKAIEELTQYLQQDEPCSLYFHDEALFELGLACLAAQQTSESKKAFKLSVDHAQQPRLAFLSSLYLARIDLSEGKFTEAEKRLSSLQKIGDPDDLLQFELSYLLGEAYFQLNNYAKAAENFERAIPKNLSEQCAWYPQTYYLLGWSYLKLGDNPLLVQNEQSRFLKKSMELFQKLMDNHPDERIRLALGQCYLTFASQLNEDSFYTKAEEVLADLQTFKSRESQAHALLLRAQAASSYGDRDKFYRQLTHETNRESESYPKGWYLRGLNNFEEGQRLALAGEANLSNLAFERAADAFEKAFELLKEIENESAGLAIKYLTLSYALRSSYESQLKAFSYITNFLEQYPDILMTLEHPDEFFYLQGSIAARLANEEEKFDDRAISALNQGIAQFPRGKFSIEILNLLGTIHYRKKNYDLAEAAYLRLAKEHSQSPMAGEALFWAANCGDQLGRDPIECRQRRITVYENYPHSPFAPEAYFNCYTYRDYLQGDRAAVKHLQAINDKFPKSLCAMQANFLIGLDYKRDRKSPEGKWIRKKDLTKAIDAFHEVECLFDDLMAKGNIPEDKNIYYLTLRYRATLERAQANLTIADESQGAKRRIYLEYAEEVFGQIVADFENPAHHLTNELLQGDPLPSIYEESCFYLAETFIKGQNSNAAEKILSKMLDRYNQLKITRGYYLSRVWQEQGMLAMSQKEYPLALECFRHAEDAAKGKGILGTDQRLDLWIQQSLCYKELNQMENAILLLSKVVNDDAISGLRLKALYLRAEIYELQGRPELARKQLLSTAKKGGEWALKAKEKLRKDYGYQ